MIVSTMPGKPGSQRILVIKLGALGDVVLSTPLLARILEAHTADEVTLLTAPDYVDLLAGFPRLHIVAFRRKGVIEMPRVLRWLLGQQFDRVYDLQGSVRSRVMTLLSQAPLRAGPAPALAYTHAPPPGAMYVHAFDRFNAVLVAAGIDAAAPDLRLSIDDSTVSRVSRWLQQHELTGKRLVLMHAGGSPAWPSKRWPEQHFLKLAQLLSGHGITVVWLGADAERDMNQRLAGTVGVDATAAFSLPELAALGRHATFVLSNDSGPMHVLSMAGVPVYALFGPTDWRRSHALGQEAHVLRHPVECSPCYLPVCPPRRQHACLDRITPEAVLARLRSDGLL